MTIDIVFTKSRLSIEGVTESATSRVFSLTLANKIGLDGKSAYQQAVEGGYTGTEAEFESGLSHMDDIVSNTQAITQNTQAIANEVDNREQADSAVLQGAKDYTDEQIEQIPTPDVSGQIATHNASTTAHADIRAELLTAVTLPTYDPATYKITFTNINGQTVEIDLPLEQIGLTYNSVTKTLYFTNSDGQDVAIPIADLVDVYVGGSTEQVNVTVDSGNVIKATLTTAFLNTLATKTYVQDYAQPKGNYLTEETDPTVPDWAKQSTKPSYTASEVGAEPAENGDILAHSECTLEERISTLENTLSSIFSGSMVVPNLKVYDLYAQSIDLVKTGSGAPTMIPDKAGQLYVDITGRNLYFATDNAAVSNWKLS